MIECLNECVNERMNERMNERVSEWVSEWVNEWMNQRMNEWISEWASVGGCACIVGVVVSAGENTGAGGNQAATGPRSMTSDRCKKEVYWAPQAPTDSWHAVKRRFLMGGFERRGAEKPVLWRWLTLLYLRCPWSWVQRTSRDSFTRHSLQETPTDSARLWRNTKHNGPRIAREAEAGRRGNGLKNKICWTQKLKLK